MDLRLWTVARFPAGEWSVGGKLTDPDYSHCELYQMRAENAEAAKKKAQSVRAQLVKKGTPLPTQSNPYKSS